ncbi:MAG: hypothetical protein LBK75_10815 [Oscillospiraceae bacterium]|jgi:hypothetical protein|nr:hypothetical protein [Oscillospiraceae bacterium]
MNSSVRRYTPRAKALALLLCLCVAAAAVSSAVFVLTHNHDHEGPGGCCAVCAQVLGQWLKQCSQTAIAVWLVVVWLRTVHTVWKTLAALGGCVSPVRLKVRCNN